MCPQYSSCLVLLVFLSTWSWGERTFSRWNIKWIFFNSLYLKVTKITLVIHISEYFEIQNNSFPFSEMLHNNLKNLLILTSQAFVNSACYSIMKKKKPQQSSQTNIVSQRLQSTRCSILLHKIKFLNL